MAPRPVPLDLTIATAAADSASTPAALRSPTNLAVPGPTSPRIQHGSAGGGPASPATATPGSLRSPRSPSLHAPNVVTRAQLRKRFQDFDDPVVYKDIMDRSRLDDAKNFVIYFGAQKAMVAHDLSEDEMQLLLETKDLELGYDMPVRWINIWDPTPQRTITEAIGQRYGFSARLTLSIWAWDHVKDALERKAKAKAEKKVEKTKARHGTGRRDDDLEMGSGGINGATNGHANGTPDWGFSTAMSPGAKSPAVSVNERLSFTTAGLNDLLDETNMATFQIMQNTIDYTSIDQENHFLCIGANWLHERPRRDNLKKPSLIPPKHWSWFCLCDDYNVLSFHEKPHYSKVPEGEDEQQWKKDELRNMRSNTLKVLGQLSLVGLEKDKHKIMQLTSVRYPLMNLNAGRTISQNHHGIEGSSNLFYYLFEDYAATFHVLKDSKIALGAIGGRVLRTADWRYKEDTSDIIPTLYRLNKELRQLHHLFTNYKILIERLLQTDSLEGITVASTSSVGDLSRDLLSAKACNRFRRLQVQLQSLMLDTIKDYLDEKESLQGTYFNLTNQKDSQATERLTRSATLLAKLSVFFLPISFMTSYFSVQIPDMINGYTAWSYWGAFCVIAGCSFISLFFFSRVLMFVSERLEHFSDKAAQWIAYKTNRGRRARAARAMPVEED